MCKHYNSHHILTLNIFHACDFLFLLQHGKQWSGMSPFISDFMQHSFLIIGSTFLQPHPESAPFHLRKTHRRDECVTQGSGNFSDSSTLLLNLAKGKLSHRKNNEAAHAMAYFHKIRQQTQGFIYLLVLILFYSY